MSSLYLSLKHLPLPQGYVLNRSAWGKMELIYDDTFDQIPLFSMEWYIKDFIAWFLHSHLRGAYENFGWRCCLEGESIAQAFARRAKAQITNHVDYMSSHCLQIPFFHSYRCPEIYIGLRKEPHEGEISLFHPLPENSASNTATKATYPEPEWAYHFDLKNYLHDARLEVREFLWDWREISPDKATKSDVAYFLQLLENAPE